eukprot:maker-scaffold495_size155559-snap-gene-0.35 protein:Tk09242 transcript:maker-scaffold495_size155559-snap-gene-0.35-mRNA-1 annotation:"---NA---"
MGQQGGPLKAPLSSRGREESPQCRVLSEEECTCQGEPFARIRWFTPPQESGERKVSPQLTPLQHPFRAQFLTTLKGPEKPGDNQLDKEKTKKRHWPLLWKNHGYPAVSERPRPLARKRKRQTRPLFRFRSLRRGPSTDRRLLLSDVLLPKPRRLFANAATTSLLNELNEFLDLPTRSHERRAKKPKRRIHRPFLGGSKGQGADYDHYNYDFDESKDYNDEFFFDEEDDQDELTSYFDHEKDEDKKKKKAQVLAPTLPKGEGNSYGFSDLLFKPDKDLIQDFASYDDFDESGDSKSPYPSDEFGIPDFEEYEEADEEDADYQDPPPLLVQPPPSHFQPTFNIQPVNFMKSKPFTGPPFDGEIHHNYPRPPQHNFHRPNHGHHHNPPHARPVHNYHPHRPHPSRPHHSSTPHIQELHYDNGPAEVEEFLHGPPPRPPRLGFNPHQGFEHANGPTSHPHGGPSDNSAHGHHESGLRLPQGFESFDEHQGPLHDTFRPQLPDHQFDFRPKPIVFEGRPPADIHLEDHHLNAIDHGPSGQPPRRPSGFDKGVSGSQADGCHAPNGKFYAPGSTWAMQASSTARAVTSGITSTTGSEATATGMGSTSEATATGMASTS